MKKKLFCIIMAMGYLAMLFVSVTGKVAFLQMYSTSIRYGGYLWLYIGMVCYFFFVLGMDYWFLDGNKKIKKNPQKNVLCSTNCIIGCTFYP